MSLRLRLTLVATAVVAVVVAAASVTTYFVMRHELYSQVDHTIEQHASHLQQDPGDVLRSLGPFGSDYVTVVDPGGEIAGGVVLPVDAHVRAVASGTGHSFFRDTVARISRETAFGCASSSHRSMAAR